MRLVANQKAEMVRVTKLYDAELERLRKLWSAAQPGSMGIIASAGGAGRRRPPKTAPKDGAISRASSSAAR